jgi:hypothetical protein
MYTCHPNAPVERCRSLIGVGIGVSRLNSSHLFWRAYQDSLENNEKGTFGYNATSRANVEHMKNQAIGSVINYICRAGNGARSWMHYINH